MKWFTPVNQVPLGYLLVINNKQGNGKKVVGGHNTSSESKENLPAAAVIDVTLAKPLTVFIGTYSANETLSCQVSHYCGHAHVRTKKNVYNKHLP